MREPAQEGGAGRPGWVPGPGIVVSHCSCGHLHVNLGALTLRLEAHQLEELSSTLDRAVAAMQGEGTPPGTLLC